MKIEDLVITIETCKRLKEAGYEFPESVFVWQVYYTYGKDNNNNRVSTEVKEVILRKDIGYGTTIIDTLTLHEVYCWIREIAQSQRFQTGYPNVHNISPMETCFTDSVWVGVSPELNPLIAANRYINIILDKGVLNK